MSGRTATAVASMSAAWGTPSGNLMRTGLPGRSRECAPADGRCSRDWPVVYWDVARSLRGGPQHEGRRYRRSMGKWPHLNWTEREMTRLADAALLTRLREAKDAEAQADAPGMGRAVNDRPARPGQARLCHARRRGRHVLPW